MRKWRLLVLLREYAHSFYPGRHESPYKSSFGPGFEGSHRFEIEDDFSSLDLIRFVTADEDYSIERPSTRTARIYIFLDWTPSMAIGWGAHTRLESGVRVAELFMSGLADEGNQIGIGTFTDRIEFTPRLKTGLRALRSEMENATEKRREGTTTDFAVLREYLLSDVPAGSLVFVISDWESPTLTAEVVEEMNSRAELIPVVLLHRGEEEAGSFLSDISAVDPETGETVVCGTVENDRAYQKVFGDAGINPVELYIEDDEEVWMPLIQEYFNNWKRLRKTQRRKR